MSSSFLEMSWYWSRSRGRHCLYWLQGAASSMCQCVSHAIVAHTWNLQWYKQYIYNNNAVRSDANFQNNCSGIVDRTSVCAVNWCSKNIQTNRKMRTVVTSDHIQAKYCIKTNYSAPRTCSGPCWESLYERPPSWRGGACCPLPKNPTTLSALQVSSCDQQLCPAKRKPRTNLWNPSPPIWLAK